MSPRHSNPTQPRRDGGREIWARAPYNFVPLPDKVVLANPPLDQDDYQGLTGWIECELETCSPTYVRGMFSAEEFKAQGEKKPDELTVEEKEKRAPFFASAEEVIEGYPVPIIPGSSLRGVIRTLVEIAGYGRMRWVADSPTFTFRAVAAARDDPLRDPYQNVLGRFGSQVRAGYLERDGEDWYVRPAKMPQDMGWPEKNAYLKIKERQIRGSDVPGYRRLDSPNYEPGWYPVSFEVEPGKSRRGPYASVRQVGAQDAGYAHQGTLVCSGNMLETGQAGQRSPRRNHALVLPADPKAKRLKIAPQAVVDYLKGMTPFQKEHLGAWGGAEWGCLKHGAPVFYVPEDNHVVYFGHSPNFRIPAHPPMADRAATPLDFVPEKVRAGSEPDLADAIFGWVEEAGASPTGARAGRVFFEDARFLDARGGVWLKPKPITPRTLSGPKPTTFQHYLVQDARAGHDPDEKAALAHYGTSPKETQIRGHKLYWHKGESPDIEATAQERQHESQLTRIVPLKPGVRFSSKIRFENLRPEELGALLWAVSLPGEAGKTYRHKLGMGKPLGMGAMAITPKLHLTNRQARYAGLFTAEGWLEAAQAADATPYLEAFQNFILKDSGIAPGKDRLADVERLQQLLAILEWQDGDDAWMDATRYMEIEHGADKVNEYKERPVLPDPIQARAGEPVRPPTPQHTQRRPTRPAAQPDRSRQATASGVRTGRVKWFKRDKGFGFILEDRGGEIFVHHSNIVGTEDQVLYQGQRVEYTVGTGPQGRPTAQNVKPIE